MTEQQITYFLEAAKTLSFTKTAESFYISQSAVTQQIKNLEEELGVLLFQRRNNRIKLTPAGELFETEAKIMQAKVREVVKKVQAVHNGLNGSLNIGYLQGMEFHQFPKLIQTIHMKYPSIQMNLKRGNPYELHDMLINGTLDIAFNIKNEHLNYAGTEIYELMKYGYSVVLPVDHPLAYKDVITQDDLLGEDLILHDPHMEEVSKEKRISRGFLREDLLKNIVITENEAESILIMVAAGVGIAVLPDFDTGKIIQNMMLVSVPLDTMGYQASMIEYHRRDNDNPLISLFMEEL